MKGKKESRCFTCWRPVDKLNKVSCSIGCNKTRAKMIAEMNKGDIPKAIEYHSRRLYAVARSINAEQEQNQINEPEQPRGFQGWLNKS